MIVISGGPNTNSKPTDELIHHSLGEIRYSFVRKMYAQVTATAVVVKHAREAPMQIHDAISTCLRNRKPVYIEIACNIVQAEISAPHIPSLEYVVLRSDPANLKAAVEQAAKLLNNATTPVVVAGVKLRPMCVSEGPTANNPFIQFVESSKYAVAVMPDAKGLVPDSHPSLIGVYWGRVSQPGIATCDAVEKADAYIFFGASFTDYNTCGHTTKLEKSKLIKVNPNNVFIGDQVFPNVHLDDFMAGLQKVIVPNSTSLDTYKRAISGETVFMKNFKKPPTDGPGGEITTQYFLASLQSLILDDKSIDSLPKTIITETGDAWFGTMKLQLQENDLFEIQMQYGSIGWAVGATLGVAMATAGPCIKEKSFKRDLSKQHRRVIAVIGDGSFQLTAQELSTIIRYNLNPIIFVLNNHGYTIEEEIHKGPYNQIKNWNYSELVNIFNAKDDAEGSSGIGRGHRITKNGDLDKSIKDALAYKDGPSLIEILVDRDDCNSELSQWGKCVSLSNSRPAFLPYTQT